MNLDDMIDLCKPEADSNLRLEKYPFCGSDEAVYMSYNHKSGKRWAVVCMGCMAEVDPGWAQQKHQVQEMWNRRTA